MWLERGAHPAGRARGAVLARLGAADIQASSAIVILSLSPSPLSSHRLSTEVDRKSSCSARSGANADAGQAPEACPALGQRARPVRRCEDAERPAASVEGQTAGREPVCRHHARAEMQRWQAAVAVVVRPVPSTGSNLPEPGGALAAGDRG